MTRLQSDAILRPGWRPGCYGTSLSFPPDTTQEELLEVTYDLERLSMRMSHAFLILLGSWASDWTHAPVQNTVFACLSDDRAVQIFCVRDHQQRSGAEVYAFSP